MAKKGFLEGYKTYDTSNGFGNTKKWREAFNNRMGKEEAQAIIDTQPDTPYSILGVYPHASKEEIKKAYRKLIMEWHPDKNPQRLIKAEEMSKKIIAAYTILIG